MEPKEILALAQASAAPRAITTMIAVVTVLTVQSTEQPCDESGWFTVNVSDLVECAGPAALTACNRLKAKGHISWRAEGGTYRCKPQWAVQGSANSPSITPQKTAQPEKSTGNACDLFGNPLPLPRSPKAKAYTADSELVQEIYMLYPRNVGPKLGKEAIAKVLNGGMDGQALRESVERYRRVIRDELGITSPKDDRMKKVPHPATWFNQRRWEEPEHEWSNRLVAFHNNITPFAMVNTARRAACDPRAQEI